MMQASPTVWPARAVHDTVQAILGNHAYRRNLTDTILERVLLWLGEGISKLLHAMRGIPGGRNIAIGVVALVVILVVARLLVAAHARDGEVISFGPRRTTRRSDDPWRVAEQLAAAGDIEGAVHSLYRGVLASLHQAERIRLDPSKTSGDYARDLRARSSASLHPFRAFARRFDSAVYGRTAFDAALYDDLRRLAEPLRDRARAA